MKRIAGIVALLVVVMVTAAFAAGYKNLTSGEAKGLLEKDKSVYVLDVRTPEEYRQARIAGAVLIPVNEIERRLGEIPKKRPVLVYCAVGSRSGKVAGYLAERGYREVYNMPDGLVGWYRNGFPISR
jgi:rhodanese-related sulfurtransferase